MRIKLARKSDQSDHDPLLCQVIEGEEGDLRKRTFTVKVGEEIELPTDVAVELMSKNKGLFEIVSSESLSAKAAGYATKDLKAK
jgi:hypothetical protein